MDTIKDFVEFVRKIRKLFWRTIPKGYNYSVAFIIHTIVLACLVCLIDNPLGVLANLLFLAPVAGFIMFIPWKKATCILESVLFFAVYYANQYVLSAKGTYIKYIDLLQAKTAFMVAGAYKPPFTFMILVKFVLFIAWTVIMLKWLKKFERPGYGKQILNNMITITAGMVFTVAFALIGDPYMLGWGEYEYYHTHGYFWGLYNEYLCEKRQSNPPEGYTDELAENIIDNIDAADDTQNIVPKNIVVVMNEAFCDYDLIGQTMMKDDPISYFHSLSENCVKGKLYVNVFGGSTSITEFEFLAGCPICYSLSSVPYMNVSLEGLKSIVSDFNDQGWDTIGMHPFRKNGYNRQTVYSDLGFSESVFGENWFEDYQKKDSFLPQDIDDILGKEKDSGIDYGDFEYYRGLASDRDCFKKITEKMKETENSFIFCVTMQNHGAYKVGELEEEVLYEYITEDIPNTYNKSFAGYHPDDFKETKYFDKDVVGAANQYLSLIHLSDQAFGEFIEEMINFDEPTMVIMFGDHEPMLDFGWYDHKYSDSDNELEQIADYYITPYIIWTNYDSNLTAPEKISANYLSLVIKQNAGMNLDAFDQVRMKAMEKYPVFTNNFAIDSDGRYVSRDEALDDQTLKDYGYVMYYRWKQRK